jgi:8-oxo-dGTP pyrophosphatase MutT (NUDIX family)
LIWEVILDYCKRYPAEKDYLISKLSFLEKIENPFPRNLSPGHITGSGIVIRHQEILLIHHRYIKEWFQPGGHVDPNELPLQSAIRELEEETGWKTIPSPLHPLEIPIDIDIHVIPANPLKNEPEHLHIDFAYLLEPVSEGKASDPETVAWFRLETCTAPRLARCIQKYLALASH